MDESLKFKLIVQDVLYKVYKYLIILSTRNLTYSGTQSTTTARQMYNWFKIIVQQFLYKEIKEHILNITAKDQNNSGDKQKKHFFSSRE